MSLRALARKVGVSHSHLSRVARRKDYKTPSLELMERVASALGLPNDYFYEYRELSVIERIKADPALRDELYDRLLGGTGR